MHGRRVLGKSITFIGLDVHKDTIAVALAEAGGRSAVREYGRIANTPTALKALAAKLSRVESELRFCYEAGPCGYGIQRQLTLAGHDCVVVAPSLIPRKPGDRVKTDRRDAISLAKLHRAGELTPVWVPDPAHEAIRDLVRARLAAVRSLRQARQQLTSFLLRHGHHYASCRGSSGRSPDTCRSPALDALRSIADITIRRSSPTPHPSQMNKAGGAVTARRTLEPTNSRISSDAGSQTEEAPRRITGPAVANPRIRA